MAIEREKAKKDSLLSVHRTIISDLITSKQTHKSYKDSVYSVLQDNERCENERLKLEHEEWKQEREEATRARLAEEKKGPEWINGSWNITTTFVNPLTGSVSMVKSSLQIDREDQFISSVTISYPDNQRITVMGNYTIRDGVIHCKDYYWDLDMTNHRIGYGDGKYYTK
ncbi:MAG: hypothetical protein K2M12_03280 [Muribaculaceae bacterium]|nr:hypothetical protein [Muribaculaceae bacterium]